MSTKPSLSKVHIGQVVTLLNKMAESDGEAMSNLVGLRVACHKVLVGDPMVVPYESEYGTMLMGLLEVLNRLFGPDVTITAVTVKKPSDIRFKLQHKSDI